MKAKMI